MRKLSIILLALLAMQAAGCRATVSTSNNNHIPATLDKPLWESSQEASVKAEAATDKQEKSRLAQVGIDYADECVMKLPEEAACYYWRAINTGIYYSAHVIGYQAGIRSMVKDCEKVIVLDEKFDHAGAYRTLGKIYTDVPETTITKNGVRRDIDKAISYLQKAAQIDPAYPENQIYLAAALLEAGKKKEAGTCLMNSISLTPQWKNHRDYAMWKKLNKELSDKLK